MERRFLRQGGAYEDSPLAVHARWTLILVHLPAMRGRNLHEDLTDLYLEAERSYVGEQLGAAYDLACLQYRFLLFLAGNRLGFTHVLSYYIGVADMWRNRLADRHGDTLPWRRKEYEDGREVVRKSIVLPVRGYKLH